jgi:hypothetical protein
MAGRKVRARATPPAARLPRWTRCQSFANPSLAMYWNMGDITIRLRSVTPADREWAEEVDLGHLPVVLGTGRAVVGCGFLRVIGTVIAHRSVSLGAFISGVDVRHAGVRISKSPDALPWLCHMTGANRADPLGAMSGLPSSSTSRGPCTSELR